MFCDQCGSSVREGVRFCGACGAGVDVPAGVNVPVTSRVAPARSNTLLIVFGICILLVLIGGLVIGVMVLNKPTESVGSAREEGGFWGMDPGGKNVSKEHLAKDRAKVSEFLLAFSACRTAITEEIQTNQRVSPAICNVDNQSYKISSDEDGLIAGRVKRGFTGNSRIDDRILTMMPLVNGTRLHLARGGAGSLAVSWICGVNLGKLMGAAELISPDYLPQSCKPDATVDAKLKSVIESGDKTYKLRTKVVSEMIFPIGECKTRISETLQANPEAPISSQLCQSASAGSEYKVSVVGGDGLIVVFAQPGHTGDAEFDGRVITLMPLVDGKYRISRTPKNHYGSLIWRCGSPQDLPPGLQMVALKYLPPSCRP